MKATLFDGSRRVIVDTRHDTCLYQAPRNAPKSPDVRIHHKDLYMHRNRNNQLQYYFHIRSTDKLEKDKILPVSPTMVDRFLSRNCEITDTTIMTDPISRLYAWGYGIAEEF